MTDIFNFDLFMHIFFKKSQAYIFLLKGMSKQVLCCETSHRIKFPRFILASLQVNVDMDPA